MKNTKNIIIIAVIIVLVGGISFYGGMQYGSSTALANATASRQARGQQFAGGNFRGGSGNPPAGGGGGFTAGEIISKDDKSVTIKLRDGGSKIVFLTSATPVMKSAAGSSQDLTVGAQVTVTGKTNPDGSLSADSIQIRPLLPANSN